MNRANNRCVTFNKETAGVACSSSGFMSLILKNLKDPQRSPSGPLGRWAISGDCLEGAISYAICFTRAVFNVFFSQ